MNAQEFETAQGKLEKYLAIDAEIKRHNELKERILRISIIIFYRTGDICSDNRLSTSPLSESDILTECQQVLISMADERIRLCEAELAAL